MKQPLQPPPAYRDVGIPIHRPPQFHPQKKKHKRSCWCCCCCYFCIILFFLILLIIAAAVILYIWIDPKLPIFHLKSLELSNFNVTESGDGPRLNAQGTVNVELKNPNKELKIIYGKTDVELKNDDGVTLGKGNSLQFMQGTKNVTVLKFGIDLNQLLDGDNVKKVTDGLKNKSLKVSTDVNTGFGIGFKGWKSGIVGVRVVCGAMTLKQIETGASPNCKISVLNLIHLVI